MPTLNGIIIYEILPNGCLNGVYTNDHAQTNKEIFNEIARKNNDNNNDDKIIGSYTCCYIDIGNIVHEATLIISAGKVRKNNRSGQYDFVWVDKTGKMIFEGTGWRTRDNQITVSYRDKT